MVRKENEVDGHGRLDHHPPLIEDGPPNAG